MILYPMMGDEPVVLFDPFRKCSVSAPLRAHLMVEDPSLRTFDHTFCGRPVRWNEVRVPWRLLAMTPLVRVCESCRRVGARARGKGEV